MKNIDHWTLIDQHQDHWGMRINQYVDRARSLYCCYLENELRKHLSRTGGQKPLIVWGCGLSGETSIHYVFDNLFDNWEAWLKGLIHE